MIPLVSVVIPTRDRLGLLAQTVHTVLAQDVDLEVVVVDEASTDGTAAWLASQGDPRLRTVHHDRPKGVPTARNAGIEASRGRWVAFVDDDDLWLPGKLRDQLTAAERAGSRWAFGGALDITGEPRLLRVTVPSEEDARRLLWSNVIPGGGSNVLVRRDLLETAGGFDPSVPIVEDWDLWIRLSLLSRPAVVQRPVLAYRIHVGNSSRKVDAMIARMRVIESRYRTERGGEGIDWDDAFRWIGAGALRAGDRAAARQVALAAVRAGHAGSLRRLVRAAAPVAPRLPVAADADRGGSALDRVRPRPVVPWPPGTEAWLRRTLQVTVA
jgi:glycosyltransferase involved in cell wall biosynthesis